MDESWIHHYIPESNRSSPEWREAGESRSKRVKASRWAAMAQRIPRRVQSTLPWSIGGDDDDDAFGSNA
ncbi:hypothetical protein ACLKA7_000202 [Drosophila subpalustris]